MFGKRFCSCAGRITVEQRAGHDPHLQVESAIHLVAWRTGVQQSGQSCTQVVEHGTDQLVLGAEMPEHQSVVDLRSGGDVADRRRGRTTLGEQVGGGLQNRRATSSRPVGVDCPRPLPNL